MTASDAERAGLVSRVVPADQLMQTAIDIAQDIAGKSRVAVAKAKECINRAAEESLSEGVRFEQCVPAPPRTPACMTFVLCALCSGIRALGSGIGALGFENRAQGSGLWERQRT